MLIKNKILLYEGLEKYLLTQGIEILKEEKKQIQKEINNPGSSITAINNLEKNK